MKRKSQNQKVLNYLKKFGKMTAKDGIQLGIYRLASRIYDLREQGHEIETVMKHKGQTKWAVYKLVKS